MKRRATELSPTSVTASNVLAVIVSYNGTALTRRAVESLRGQVTNIHIVDNGSEPESLAILDSLEQGANVTVERLGTNKGVGYALNRGVRRAQKLGFSWLLTMDQDSVVDSNLIRAFQEAVHKNPRHISLAPQIIAGSYNKHVRSGVIPYAITSGNLVRVSLFDQVGLYDEGFFVDCIDFDFCLRLRRAGHLIHSVSAARIHHEVGESVNVPLAMRRYYARHSPVRRYYMYRNYMFLVERYLFSFPLFLLKLGLGQLLLLLLIGLFDTHALSSYRAIARGIRDYVARRDGQLMEHV